MQLFFPRKKTAAKLEFPIPLKILLIIMPKAKLPIGIQDFEKIITGEYTYNVSQILWPG